MHSARFTVLSSLFAFVCAGSAHAADLALLRDRTPATRPTLLVVGVAHFSNPGRDMINMKVDDVLAPQRQKEIAELIQRLATFKPTRVAVEWPIAEQAKLDERYRNYRNDSYTLTRNEVDQVGLRLAALLKLERVDAVDWNEDPPGREVDYDFEAWAKAHAQTDRLEALFGAGKPNGDQALLEKSTLPQFICALNTPARFAADHRTYFDIALIGDARDTPGATWVGNWYARNLRIFDNLVRIAPGKDDRVLAVYGAGHGFLLHAFATESGAFTTTDLHDVLRCR